MPIIFRCDFPHCSASCVHHLSNKRLQVRAQEFTPVPLAFHSDMENGWTVKLYADLSKRALLLCPIHSHTQSFIDEATSLLNTPAEKRRVLLSFSEVTALRHCVDLMNTGVETLSSPDTVDAWLERRRKHFP